MVDHFRLLFVCTANICRSPMAEVIARQLLWLPREVPGGQLLVGSAGTRGRDGEVMAEGTVLALHALAVPAGPFRSRTVTQHLIAEADLVLTAGREHRSDVLALEPRAFRRTFTLLEFARLAAELRAPSWAPGDSMAYRAAQLTDEIAGHRGGSPPVVPGRDDIADPYGGPLEGYHLCARQIRQALEDARLFLVGDGASWPTGTSSMRAAAPGPPRYY